MTYVVIASQVIIKVLVTPMTDKSPKPLYNTDISGSTVPKLALE